ncbi:hypothetical protein EYF80_062056 [Liparis tanakae]|uniref:Uncharacterized protein n=1 Tax=Liparis tanakae TaxID=230148 RepID=A0A4Z2EFS4_9TELE|nr:hypothetical protein EYF80_062056 [Liparis tanakae]
MSDGDMQDTGEEAGHGGTFRADATRAPACSMQAYIRAAASSGVAPPGSLPLTRAPPSTSRRTRRSLQEAAAMMRGLLSDRGSAMACRSRIG